MKNVERFLLNNGFEKLSEDSFHNGKCQVDEVNCKDKYSYYMVTLGKDDLEYQIFSDNLNIYWLIGILTWHDLMDKNYNKEF